MTQADSGLLLHCFGCGRNRPRGWFARSGDGRRTSWCRECRAPGRALEAAKRRGAGVTRTPPGTVQRLLVAQRWTCPWCQGAIHFGAKVHLDHWRSIAKGGKHELSNLRVLHKLCNLRKNARV